jgi:hypothetical protein
MAKISLIEKEMNERFLKALFGIVLELIFLFGGATLLITSLGWQLGLGIVFMAIYVKAKE